MLGRPFRLHTATSGGSLRGPPFCLHGRPGPCGPGPKPTKRVPHEGKARGPSPKEDCLSDWAWGLGHEAWSPTAGLEAARGHATRSPRIPGLVGRQAGPNVLGHRFEIVRSYPEIDATLGKTPGRGFSGARKPRTTNDFRRRASYEGRFARARRTTPHAGPKPTKRVPHEGKARGPSPKEDCLSDWAWGSGRGARARHIQPDGRPRGCVRVTPNGGYLPSLCGWPERAENTGVFATSQY